MSAGRETTSGGGRYVALKGEGEAAPSFEAPHPRTYGRPGRDRLKAAYWAYVWGHDRGWEAERKRHEGEALAKAGAGERRRPPRGAEERTPAGSSGSLAVAPVPPGAPRFGIPVPERLSFHRGPGTWRSRLARRREGGAAED